MTREEAIHIIKARFYPSHVGLITNETMENAKALRMAVEALSERIGEWVDKGWKGDWQFETDGRGTCWRVFECSLCNGESIRKTRFCPHCGARMLRENGEV